MIQQPTSVWTRYCPSWWKTVKLLSTALKNQTQQIRQKKIKKNQTRRKFNWNPSKYGLASCTSKLESTLLQNAISHCRSKVGVDREAGRNLAKNRPDFISSHKKSDVNMNLSRSSATAAPTNRSADPPSGLILTGWKLWSGGIAGGVVVAGGRGGRRKNEKAIDFQRDCLQTLWPWSQTNNSRAGRAPADSLNQATRGRIWLPVEKIVFPQSHLTCEPRFSLSGGLEICQSAAVTLPWDTRALLVSIS